jgi:hypothetical protein
VVPKEQPLPLAQAITFLDEAPHARADGEDHRAGVSPGRRRTPVRDITAPSRTRSRPHDEASLARWAALFSARWPALRRSFSPV